MSKKNFEKEIEKYADESPMQGIERFQKIQVRDAVRYGVHLANERNKGIAKEAVDALVAEYRAKFDRNDDPTVFSEWSYRQGAADAGHTNWQTTKLQFMCLKALEEMTLKELSALHFENRIGYLRRVITGHANPHEIMVESMCKRFGEGFQDAWEKEVEYRKSFKGW